MNPFDPPAIIRSVSTIAERKARIKQMYWDDGRTKLERARDRGKELFDLRKQCQDEGVPWRATLADMGVAKSTATRDLKVWVNWGVIEEELASCSQLTLKQALILIDKHLAEEAEEEDSESAAPPSPTGPIVPKAKPILCKNCRIATVPNPKCGECKALQKAAMGQGGSSSGPKGGAAPKPPKGGAAPKPPKNGALLFDWREHDRKYGPLSQSPAQLARAYPEYSNDPDLLAADDSLEIYISSMKNLKKKITGSRE